MCCLQSNLAKQLAKLVKVKYVEDISAASRVGRHLYAHIHMCINTHAPTHMHIRACTYMHIHAPVHTHIHMSMCTYTHARVVSPASINYCFAAIRSCNMLLSITCCPILHHGQVRTQAWCCPVLLSTSCQTLLPLPVVLCVLALFIPPKGKHPVGRCAS